MNIYSLKNKELVNLQKEFKKTAFGKRAKIWSSVPVLFMIVFAFGFSASIIRDSISNELRLCFVISIVGSCIAQLMYGNMLKDYINSKKED